jgi:hypothetical protein
MKNSLKYFLIFSILLFSNSLKAEECTTGVVSWRATSDGRSILWKNRDSSFRDNEVFFFNRGGVQFTGIINADDTTQVWAGINNFGFAIMNAESRDMAVPGKNTKYDGEGYLMKDALIKCKTVDDFEKMLEETNETGRDVTSNFGVIDSYGEAAFFEVGNYEYSKFDATDKILCPEGFLIRANFAFSGYGREGYGRKRYERAYNLFENAIENSALSYSYIITEITRDIFLPDKENEKDSNKIYYKTSETINRYRTVSCAIFRSAKEKENPGLTTFWCALGEPSVTIFVPLWTYSMSVPTILDSIGGSPLNNAFQKLESYVYSDTPKEDTINIEKLSTIQKEIDKTQNYIFRKTDKKMKKWRKNPPNPTAVASFQDKMAQKAYSKCQELILKISE